MRDESRDAWRLVSRLVLIATILAGIAVAVAIQRHDLDRVWIVPPTSESSGYVPCIAHDNPEGRGIGLPDCKWRWPGAVIICKTSVLAKPASELLGVSLPTRLVYYVPTGDTAESGGERLHEYRCVDEAAYEAQLVTAVRAHYER